MNAKISKVNFKDIMILITNISSFRFRKNSNLRVNIRALKIIIIKEGGRASNKRVHRFSNFFPSLKVAKGVKKTKEKREKGDLEIVAGLDSSARTVILVLIIRIQRVLRKQLDLSTP